MTNWKLLFDAMLRKTFGDHPPEIPDVPSYTQEYEGAPWPQDSKEKGSNGKATGSR